MTGDEIILDWLGVGDDSDRWNCTVALYAIQHPTTYEILYLGKADGYTSTVRRRWNADDKHDRVWSRIEKELGLFEHCFLIGEFDTIPVGSRLSRELVCDVESLLIHRIRPWANSKNTKSRGWTRPGMVVVCQGEWPLRQKTYRDQ